MDDRTFELATTLSAEVENLRAVALVGMAMVVAARADHSEILRLIEKLLAEPPAPDRLDSPEATRFHETICAQVPERSDRFMRDLRALVKRLSTNG